MPRNVKRISTEVSVKLADGAELTLVTTSHQEVGVRRAPVVETTTMTVARTTTSVGRTDYDTQMTLEQISVKLLPHERAAIVEALGGRMDDGRRGSDD